MRNAVDHWRMGIAVASLLGLVGIFIYAAYDKDAVSTIQSTNGDAVGQESGESLQAYTVRAREALAATGDEESVFGLVSFRTPLDPAQVEDILQAVPRLSAIVMGKVRPLALPEPTGQETRADVISRYMGYASQLLKGTEYGTSQQQITGAVVYATGAQLRSVAQHDGVYAVETLPAGAYWNGFGVRPVNVPD